MGQQRIGKHQTNYNAEKYAPENIFVNLLFIWHFFVSQITTQNGKNNNAESKHNE